MPPATIAEQDYKTNTFVPHRVLLQLRRTLLLHKVCKFYFLQSPSGRAC